MNLRLTLIATMFIFTVANLAYSDEGRITGNFQYDGQSYGKDSLIGAPIVAEKIMNQGFMNMIYTNGNIEIGTRYEFYRNPLLGIDGRFEGSGIPFRYFTYRSDLIDITAGNFYHQIGSGMIFRSYEERALGIDNAMDGARAIIRPLNGIDVTVLAGKQRDFWGLGRGIVRGADLNINLNELAPDYMPEDYTVILGAGVVSKYQQDLQSVYNLPENVLAYSLRSAVMGESFSVDAEYGYKYNDPSSANGFNYNPGIGLIINGSYFGNGFSASVNAHHLDNFDFRSDRSALFNNVLMSFVPPLTRQHTYRISSMFPYGTQLLGEMGYQADLTYKVPRNSALGGEYGIDINVNYSIVNSIDKQPIDEFRYESSLFKPGDRTYFRDMNIEIGKKFTSDFKANLNLVSIKYDRDLLENGDAPKWGMVSSNIGILEMLYKFDSRNAIRTELQHSWTTTDSTLKEPDNLDGNWIFLLAEYTVAPSWYISVFDEFNYGNENPDLRLHYLSGAVAYIHDATRIAVGYGRQRGGILCVGGVCRPVPASNGFNLSITSSF